MSRKPNCMYREIRGQANTRREYMGGVPASRITQFDLGHKKGEFSIMVSLIAKEQCQIRHTALESARIAANRHMTKKAGTLGFHLKIRIHPHVVLRENKQATGAGADRVSQGMRKSFGKAVGTAARIKPGQKLISIRTTKPHYLTAKNALRRASMKLPTPCTVVLDYGEVEET
ncbi:MAG: 50S ribosomal protein L16 [Thermoplasmata archaeon]|nr:MAG: 50S ribosomal protein L16 [Thermoplasmata archaeon]